MLAQMVEPWQQTALAGVMRRSLHVSGDIRGFFSELWRASWTEPLGVGRFVQANVSRSAAGVLRGLHFHMRQADLWVVLEGRAHVVLVDVREPLAGRAGSPVIFGETIGANEAIVIPEGVAHGFWALEPLTLLYLVTNEYDGTDEHGFAWDDPAVGAAWPLEASSARPIVSERDAAAPSLADAVTRALTARSA